MIPFNARSGCLYYMIKKLAFTLVVLLLIVGFLVGIKYYQIDALIQSGKGRQIPAETVSSVKVGSQKWRASVNSVGTVEAVHGVTLSAEVGGRITAIHFQSGDVVKEGTVLAEMDSSSERAQLRAAEAAYELAKINLERNRELRSSRTIAQAELDTAEAQSKESEAQVENLKAVIAKKTVIAPFDGVLGIKEVNLGQYVNPGDPVVTLQSSGPRYVNFYLPQQNLSWIRNGLAVEVYGEAIGEQEAVSGTITALESKVNVATRNIQVQATVEDAKERLKPGMFVNVRVFKDGERDVLSVPTTAIMYASYGNSVYVVEKAKQGEGFEANQHFVRLGEHKGDFVEVLEGLKEGDEVVSAGAFKLRNGVPVVTNNQNTPKLETDPQLQDS